MQSRGVRSYSVFGIDLIWDRVSWQLALGQRRPNAQTNHNRGQHIDTHSYRAIPIILGLPDLILLPPVELAAFEEAIAFLVVAIHELEIRDQERREPILVTLGSSRPSPSHSTVKSTAVDPEPTPAVTPGPAWWGWETRH